MLFLFNDVVFKLDDPAEELAAAGCPVSLSAAEHLPAAHLGTLLREAAFARPGLARETPEKARALAAVVQLRTGANAVLLVCPPNAGGPQDVLLRFADVSMEVIATLSAQQNDDRLNAADVDRCVWSSAA